MEREYMQFCFRSNPLSSTVQYLPIQKSPGLHCDTPGNAHPLSIHETEIRDPSPDFDSEIHRFVLCDHGTLDWILDDQAGQHDTTQTIVVGFKGNLVVGQEGGDIDEGKVKFGPSDKIPGEEKRTGRVLARVVGQQRMRLNGTARGLACTRQDRKDPSM